MNIMTYGGYHARIEYDDEDGLFFGRISGIDDIIGFHAASVEELKAAFHAAVDDFIGACAKIGKQPMRPFSGKMMFRVDPDVHRRSAIAADLAGKSLNQWAEEALGKAAEELTGPKP